MNSSGLFIYSMSPTNEQNMSSNGGYQLVRFPRESLLTSLARVFSKFRFSGERLKFLEGLLAKNFLAIYLFMKSTVYFRFGGPDPAHSVDKALTKSMLCT
jgi:hypothetical protein